VLAVCGLLLLAVIAVFGQTASHDFVNFDDDVYVYENRRVQQGLTGEGIAWAIGAYHACNWHPLTWLSHMLDCQLYHLKPGGHHLTNLLLHAVTAVLVFLSLQRMTGALWRSAWVAAVFAIHPLRVESVAWVAERKDVLSGLFFMLTLWFYARYAERPASWDRYVLVVASFALGLTAKPMLVTLPFVLLLLDYWPLRRVAGGGRWAVVSRPGVEGRGLPPTHRPLPTAPYPPPTARHPLPTAHRPPSTPALRLIVEKLPLLALAAASCAVTLSAQRDAMQSLERVAFSERVANAAVAYVSYLGKMFCPTALAALYPFPRNPLPIWEVVAAVTVLLAISMAVFVARRKCPCLLFGWLWYLGTLVPVIGLVQVGGQAMADRYTYMTQIGPYTALAWGTVCVVGSWPYRRWAFAGFSALMFAGLMVCAWQQMRFWRDSETLWKHTLDCTSQNYLAHNDLGVDLAGRGEVGAAIFQYQKALEIKPDYAEAYNNLGNVLAGHGQAVAAITDFQTALEIKPDYAEAHYNLGAALAGRGEVGAAIVHLKRALEIKPDYAKAHNKLGNLIADRGDADAAIAHFQKALEIKPDYSDAHNELGVALAGRGEVDAAIAHFQRALEIEPDYAEAHYNLGVALAGRGAVDAAIAHFQKALEIKPDIAEAHNRLGVALAGRGEIGAAIAHFQKALEIKPDYAEARRNLDRAREK